MAVSGVRRRIFIAVDLDPPLRDAILHLEERLREAGAPLRWIPPENLHFTVRFLGEIAPAQLALVRRVTREVASAASPFRLVLEGVGAFPSVQRPQVVWVGVREGSEELALISSRLDAALARHGFPREDRPFVAHLTITRLKHDRRWAEVVRALSGFREVPVGSQQVTLLSIVESHLNPRGARYTRVEEVPLGRILNGVEGDR
ncbi:MAG: RNA 2',3'-cyclic phosphodiesterase [Armatimonadetes bacterium]|nr:RNA 2',3'-cyclic phosphodiesterase [Armatimonadota bacterium]